MQWRPTRFPLPKEIYMDDCKITQEVMNRMPMKVFWEVQTLENHMNPDYGE